jgi:DeoR family transcriptional regulator of aga operon
MNKILREERQSRILQEVQIHGQVTATGLSHDFGVSEITIRRDLRDLADEGLLRRTYGGAVIAQSELTDPPVLQRMSRKSAYKEIIGRAAAELVNEGDSIFIGSGSTTTYVARELANKDKLTVVTNALNIATELATVEGITVIVIGGLMRSSELSLVGHIAEKALLEVRMDKVIMGIPAIDLEAGLTNDYMPEVMTDRALLDMTNEFILVADHTKFCIVCSAYLSPISAVTSLVTDYKTDKSTLDSIRKLGVSVIVAQEDR